VIKKLSADEIKNIYKLRIEEGLTGREIAEKIGVCQKTIWYHLNPNAKKYQREYNKMKRATDEEYKKKENERCRKYQENRRKRDPTWNAERQREFRKKHPISFYIMMARYYLRKLSKEEIKKILKEIGYDR
jgi:transcriptional regulator with XRE-family HTH domain